VTKFDCRSVSMGPLLAVSLSRPRVARVQIIACV
jgi:hypothetical protein